MAYIVLDRIFLFRLRVNTVANSCTALCMYILIVFEKLLSDLVPANFIFNAVFVKQL
jgi:hypothetical protein